MTSRPERESKTLSRHLPKLTPAAIRPTVLAYHELSQETAPEYRYAVRIRDFEAHLQLAAELQEVAGSSSSPLTFTFDDGHISSYLSALPLLEQHLCKATFFVIAGRIGRTPDCMDWAQLQELVALGHHVEAHGWSHNFLTQCSDADLRKETLHAKETLQDRLGVAVEAIAVPHGRWDRRVARACAEAGFRSLYASTPWTASSRVEGIEVMGRLMVTRSMDVQRLAEWLAMGRPRATFHRTAVALKHSLRGLLGDTIYHRLWMRFAGWDGPANG